VRVACGTAHPGSQPQGDPMIHELYAKLEKLIAESEKNRGKRPNY
jgi:hypothetical protein